MSLWIVWRGERGSKATLIEFDGKMCLGETMSSYEKRKQMGICE